ncbi:MAG: hypothetical protein HOW73_43560 [Polyangiaceae bacterium]|nr:hypothetical protein [Polyangiaceae bacterium]
MRWREVVAALLCVVLGTLALWFGAFAKWMARGAMACARVSGVIDAPAAKKSPPKVDAPPAKGPYRTAAVRERFDELPPVLLPPGVSTSEAVAALRPRVIPVRVPDDSTRIVRR